MYFILFYKSLYYKEESVAVSKESEPRTVFSPENGHKTFFVRVHTRNRQFE